MSTPILRFAYAALFLIALIAVFTLWSQVGGQSHLDVMPWYYKLGLGAGTAYAIVKATAAAMSRESAWNGGTLRWTGIAVALLIACGLVSFYAHVYWEDDDQPDDSQDQGQIGAMEWPAEIQRAFRLTGTRVTVALDLQQLHAD